MLIIIIMLIIMLIIIIIITIIIIIIITIIIIIILILIIIIISALKILHLTVEYLKFFPTLNFSCRMETAEVGWHLYIWLILTNPFKFVV